MNVRSPFALAFAALVALAAAPAYADTLAPGFTPHTVSAGGRVIHYNVGGHGPAVILLHGFGDTSHMWAPLAPMLAKDHAVIVPDLPGIGDSRPEGWNDHYDMASVARSLHALVRSLGVKREAVIGHDIGLMAAYAYAAQYPSEVTKLALIDAPIPRVGPWQQVLLTPALWHFNFNGKYAEALVAGRERIYLDRTWHDFGYHPERITEATREYYATSYAQPGNMHAAMQYFAAFSTDARQNVAFAKNPLRMPVLAMGGAKSFGALMPQFARAVATHVQTSVIPDSGHWVMDENPAATEAALLRFIRST
jgi:pimeloyl-ACP methyl ester carboxylesterase